jgi:hypothetical protein
MDDLPTLALSVRPKDADPVKVEIVVGRVRLDRTILLRTEAQKRLERFLQTGWLAVAVDPTPCT